MKRLYPFLLTLLLIVCASCEKIYLPVNISKGEDPNGNITLCVSAYDQLPFTPAGAPQSVPQLCAAQPIKGISSRLNFAVFQNGERLKNISQKADDQGFGSVKLALAPGSYELVIVGHNSMGTATLTAPTEITFPSNRVTDTFYYYGTLTVGEQPATHNLTLVRAVAKFRFVLRDTKLPADFTQMKFYYTGGSSTFDATLGVGAKQSRQTEVFPLAEASKDAEGHPYFEVYTFPHTDPDALKMTITAQNAAGAPLLERIFIEVPVVRNQITQYAGIFFQENAGNPQDVTLTADPEWAAQKNFVF